MKSLDPMMKRKREQRSVIFFSASVLSPVTIEFVLSVAVKVALFCTFFLLHTDVYFIRTVFPAGRPFTI